LLALLALLARFVRDAVAQRLHPAHELARTIERARLTGLARAAAHGASRLAHLLRHLAEVLGDLSLERIRIFG
jgi:hypothetical protein